jgi:hypothetical protein
MDAMDAIDLDDERPQQPVEMVPPIDGLDLLVDGGEFILVRAQDRFGERIRVGIRDSAVRVLLVVRPRANRAKFVAMLAGVIVTVFIAFAVPIGIGLSPLLAMALAITIAVFGLVIVLLTQPVREYRFHDDLPGGLDRPPLLTLIERSGKQSSYALRDEKGRTIGDIARRLGKWRVRAFEPIDPPPPPEDEPDPTFAPIGVTGRLYAWSVAMSEEEPTPSGPAVEVSASIVRDYLNLASIIGGLVSGPIGLVLALSGPWKRIEFRRGSGVLAIGHRLDEGNAMRLELDPGFDIAGGDGDWFDRRHLLALAVLSLSFEADR